MSKYKNKKITLDGITFDSIKESNRYLELKLQEREGDICELELQPVFKYMSEDGKKVLFKYIADFRYLTPSPTSEIIEDVKSEYTAKLPLFRLKKKLIEDRFGIKIELV